MDDKLFQRGQAAGAILVAASYFLPWASVMSPLGSVQLRGLYVDYAWALLILALLHLLSQFARPNKDTLGLTEKSMKYVGLAWRLVPCALIGFFAWYAAKFVMGTHTTGGTAAAFGISLDSTVKAGLDYGYWIGAAGSILLVLSVGFLDHQIVRLISYAGVIAVVSIGLAYGFSLPGRHFQPSSTTASSGGGISGTQPSTVPAVEGDSVQPDFDASPYVQVSSITGQTLPKNYDASRYSNTVLISRVFKNIGTKAIVGLQGRVSVIDGFGKEVYAFP